MDYVLRHVSVEPGDHVVARFGNAAGVFGTPSDAESDRVEELIEALEAAGQTSAFPGEELVKRLAPLVLGAGKSGLPPFALVAAIQKGFVVLLHGSAWAHLTSEDSTLHLSGDSALTWVDRIVTGSYSEIALTVTPGVQRPTNPRSDLRLGSVTGNGLAVRMKGAPSRGERPAAAPAKAPAPEAQKPAARAPKTSPAPAVEKPSTAKPHRTAPNPIIAVVPETEQTQAASAASFLLDDETQASPVVKTGRASLKTGAAKFLSGKSAAKDPSKEITLGGEATVAGPAPDSSETQLSPVFSAAPSQVLVGADGSRVFLDRNYVLGRDPRSDPAVRRGEASPITIPDTSDALSRVHAYIDSGKGKITVRDNSSTNGTFVAEPGAQQWVKIGNDPVEVHSGWAVCLGNRVYVVQPPESAAN